MAEHGAAGLVPRHSAVAVLHRPHRVAVRRGDGGHDVAVTTDPPNPLRDVIRRSLADAWALIAPVDCAGCGAPDRALCPSCVIGLPSRLLLGAIDVVGLPVPVVAGLPYEGVARRVVLALKEEGRTELARQLAAPLAAAVEAVWRGSGAEFLVPVPGSWVATARRGFQPVALVARRAGFVVTPGLRTVRPRTTVVGAAPALQKSRTLAERLAADAPRWRVSPRVRGQRVVLVDDVVTSGATLRAAVLALREAGAEVAGCAAIAATPRRVGTSSIHWRFMADGDEGPGDNDPAEDYRERKEA